MSSLHQTLNHTVLKSSFKNLWLHRFRYQLDRFILLVESKEQKYIIKIDAKFWGMAHFILYPPLHTRIQFLFYDDSKLSKLLTRWLSMHWNEFTKKINNFDKKVMLESNTSDFFLFWGFKSDWGGKSVVTNYEFFIYNFYVILQNF